MNVYLLHKKGFIILVLLFLMQSTGIAQGTRGNDTSYYVYFPGGITGRIFFSQKYLSYTLKSKELKDLHYNPATSSNIGVGLTYHNLSANFAYSFGLKKDKNAEKGKTKYLDLQTHYYSAKWMTDLYAQFYKGYHLSDGYAAPIGSLYYYRPDMKVTLLGISRYRIFNPNRFSYKAAMLQNEWQKKSAGTFLAGAEAYYGAVKADSSLVPKFVNDGFEINKVNYVSIGPGIGYAYTLVLFHHLFVMASLTGNVNFSYTTEHIMDNKDRHISVNPVANFKVAAGYNGRVWNVSANWVANNLPFKGNNDQRNYLINTGNYRFVVARQFQPGKKLKKHLKKIDQFVKE